MLVEGWSRCVAHIGQVEREHRHDMIKRQPVERDVVAAVAAVRGRVANVRDHRPVLLRDALWGARRARGQLIEEHVVGLDRHVVLRPANTHTKE